MLESCQAAPPPSSVAGMCNNLTFSDMMFIGLSPVQRIIFYSNPVSKVNFIDTIIPKLKISLSHVLKYFPSLAGNCIIPSDSSKPNIRYVDGDSVSLVFAESNLLDFDYLVSDQSRICSDFYPLLPRLSPESVDSGGARILPVLAVQATVFPGTGFCIGIEYQHVAADGCAMYAFMKAWAMFSKFGEDEASHNNWNEFLPVYDRSVVTDHTKELDEFFWNHLRNTYSQTNMVGIKYPKPDPDRVRSTFVITSDDVQRLKIYVSNLRSMKRLSTFTIVCGYVWTCMVKLNNVAMHKADPDETEYFCCPFDFRGRVEPPIPSNYFGNCLVQCEATASNGELSGDEGFLMAVERIGEAIEKRCQGVFAGLENIFDKFAEMNWDRMFWVAGSQRLDYYKIDFGWGMARKVEIISIDSTGAVCLNGCRDGSGVPEIGVSLPREKMDAFSEIFIEGLSYL